MKIFDPHTITMRWRVDLEDPIMQRVHFEDLKRLLHSLTQHDRAHLLANPHIPLLYHSGVRYEEEPLGEENWDDVDTVLQNGWGDCEDLACWRAAELQNAGVPAFATFLHRKINPKMTLFHIVVALPPRFPFDPRRGPVQLPGCITHHPDGSVIEDPSKMLGMGRKPSQYTKLASPHLVSGLSPLIGRAA